MYVIEETSETIMENIHDPDEDANADIIEEPSSEGDSAASVSQISQSSESFELMQMRVDAKEALAKVARADQGVAKADQGELEAKIKLFEAQEQAEKRSNKSRSSRGGKKKSAGQQSSGSVTKPGCGTATQE
jgi:hypothetical protein